MIRILLLMCMAPALIAQDLPRHPFYNSLLEDGKTALGEKNWATADRFLEIAAFGLMNHRSALEEIYVLQVIVHHEMENKENELQWLSRAKRLLDADSPVKPASLSSKHWDQYLVITGVKAPPIPKKTVDLKTYVQKHPENAQAWVALLDATLGENDRSGAKDAIKNGLARHPANEALLEKALIFSVSQDRSKGAENYASKLLIVAPNNPYAHEFMAGEAVKSRNYKEAEAHFAYVKKDSFPRTTSSRIQLEDALKKLEAAERRDAEKKAREDAEEARKLKARLEKEKSDEERKARGDLAQKKTETERKEKEKARLAKKEADSKASSKKDPVKTKATETRTVAAKSKSDQSKTDKPKADITRKPEPLDPKALAAKTLKDLENRSKAKPGDSQLKFELTSLYMDQGSMDKAKKMLRKLGKTGAKADPLYAENFARYNYLKRDYQMVVKTLGKLNNLSGQTRYFLGMSYFRLQDDKNAKQVLEQLDRKEYPDLNAVDKTIAERKPLVQKKSEKDKRLKTLERKANLAASERFELIDIYLADEDWKSARKLIQKSYKESPSNKNAIYYHARLHLKEKRYSAASRSFYSLAQAKFEKPGLYYYGGLAAMRNGDKTLTDYMWDHALRNGTQFEDEIKALRQGETSSNSSTNKAKQG